MILTDFSLGRAGGVWAAVLMLLVATLSTPAQMQAEDNPLASPEVQQAEDNDFLGLKAMAVQQMKNALIDAVVQMKFDKMILAACENSGCPPEAFMKHCRCNLEWDRITVAIRSRALKDWHIPAQDIVTCFAEADQIVQNRVKLRK